MNPRLRGLAVSLLTVLCLGAGALAASPLSTPYNDEQALKGVSQGKGVFMISLDQPQKLALYLKVIGGTYDNFVNQGRAADLKVVFIGASVRHLSRSRATQGELATREVYAEIARQAERLKAKGVRLEVCAIATELFGVDNGDLLPPLELINDGFVSAIGYQTQGYQLVPIY